MKIDIPAQLLAAILGMAAMMSVPAVAQQLDAKFSCSVNRDDHGLPTLFADNGKIKINGDKIEEFYWESSLFRSTHGLDCSIDQDDGVQAEVTGDEQRNAWRFSLKDARTARDKRGYDLTHGLNCTIRVERIGDTVHINPSCPALCGSRQNFSEFSFDLKTGACHYEE